MSSFIYKHLNIPCVSVAEMKEVDRLSMEKYHIQLVQMMENAGTALATLTSNRLGDVKKKHIVVLCGIGNNGGGGLVAARHLSNWRANVTVIQVYGQMKDTPELQMKSVKQLDVRILTYSDQVQIPLIQQSLTTADMVLDALIGYGLTRDPRGLSKDLIELANQNSSDIISLDVPSGLNVDSGEPGRPCIKAKATLTLALPKKGFLSLQAKPYLGELYLGDITIPPSLYQHLGLSVEPFFNGQTYVSLVQR
jgi:NAD(P)H-hydrate epimerase